MKTFQKNLTIDSSYSDLIGRLFPGILIPRVREINIGWASHVLILGEKYVIKIPRNDVSRNELEKEIVVTSNFRKYIQVKIPEYVSQARNGDLRAAAYKLIEGILLTNQDMGEIETERLDVPSMKGYLPDIAEQLAAILNSIHGIDPVDASETLDPFTRETWLEKNLRRIMEFGTVSDSYFDKSTARKCAAYLDNIGEDIRNFAYTPKLIHGDFGGWNILYDPQKRKITGLLDWADSRIGDPAADFVELIYDFGKDFTGMVLQNYQFATEGIMERAETYLKFAGFQDLKYGIEANSDYFTEKGKKEILRLIE